MNTNALFAVWFGLFARIALPLLATALLAYGLRALDLRWQREAKRERDLLARDEAPCWKELGFPAEEIQARAAASGKPCWQNRRLSNGYLCEGCLECKVFLDAPAPALKHSNAHA